MAIATGHRAESTDDVAFRRMEQLLAVSGELVGASTRAEVASIAIERGLTAVGASYGALWAVAGDALELLSVSRCQLHRAAPYDRVPLSSDSPIVAAVTRAEPVYLESLADFAAAFPASYARNADMFHGGDHALAMFPLISKDGPIGVLSLTFVGAHHIASTDRTFLAILARQCALALERVKLYELELEIRRAAEVARDEAEASTRAREEILSVVSHDLRNPLGTILMGASTLLVPPDPDDKKAQRVFMVAERIHRQAERMARRIDDLVDYAGIQAGRIELDRKAHEPSGLIEHATRMFGPLVSERGLQLETAVAEALPVVHCDSHRALQVFSSLVTNALKVTPRGGRIAIGVEPQADDVVFFVRDTGPGIEAAELPTLFESYWRSSQQAYKGAGLGLSIARGIVDAHGGRIWAESEVGSGSTFYFSFARNN